MIHVRWIPRPSQEYLDLQQEHDFQPFPTDTGAIVVACKIPSYVTIFFIWL